MTLGASVLAQRARHRHPAVILPDTLEADRLVEGDGAGVVRPHTQVQARGSTLAGVVDPGLHQPPPPSLAPHRLQQVDVQVGGVAPEPGCRLRRGRAQQPEVAAVGRRQALRILPRRSQTQLLQARRGVLTGEPLAKGQCVQGADDVAQRPPAALARPGFGLVPAPGGEDEAAGRIVEQLRIGVDRTDQLGPAHLGGDVPAVGSRADADLVERGQVAGHSRPEEGHDCPRLTQARPRRAWERAR